MKRIDIAIIVMAWSGFFGCLFLPALQYPNGEPFIAWKAVALSLAAILEFHKSWSNFILAVVGIGNIVIVVAPLALFCRALWLRVALAFFFVLVFSVALSFSLDGGDYQAGYYMWLASFLLSAIGFGISARTARLD
jgi:hypothetical protein